MAKFVRSEPVKLFRIMLCLPNLALGKIIMYDETVKASLMMFGLTNFVCNRVMLRPWEGERFR